VQVLAIEGRDELVDLLVLLLHLPGEGLTVRKHAPDDGPQDRLLGERVRKHQPVDPDQDAVLVGTTGLLKLVEQAIQPHVFPLLPHQDAHGPAELGLVLVGE
jgi:hypothetical protein